MDVGYNKDIRVHHGKNMEKRMNKFEFKCTTCANSINSFQEWFDSGQKCPKCGEIYVETIYNQDIDYKNILSVRQINDLWHYFDLLPLNYKKNITTLGEGIFTIERWKYLENIAKKYFDTECEVRVLRNDNNPGTGTFKDLAGTVVSSVLKENKIKNYVVASTGNIASSFSRYLSVNDITLYAFIPEGTPRLQEAEIRSNGGVVYRVKGDYHNAKHMAKEFAEQNNFLLAATGIDPTRIEAKKIMAYEIFRQLQREPSVYIQALSGGTGPIGIFKGIQELIDHSIVKKQPKLLLVQSDKCAPMVDGYQNAKQKNFKGTWDKDYPIYENPETLITTIATGNPTLYPYVSKIVKESNGDILSVNESFAKDTSKLVSLTQGVNIGPAAAIAVEGYFKSLKNNLIKNGDLVIINIGEGIKRSPDYLEQFSQGDVISSIDECKIESINIIRENAIKEYIKIFKNL